MRQNRERRRSAVLACSSLLEDTPQESPPDTAWPLPAYMAWPQLVHRLDDAEDTAQKSPPYPEWPELEDRLDFYTLPTIGAHYQPALVEVNEPLEEVPVRSTPHVNPFKTHLLLMLLKYCELRFGTEAKGRVEEVLARFNSYFEGFDTVLFSEEEPTRKFARAYLGLSRQLSLRSDFSQAHEADHRLSFAINRPATKEFKDTAAEIFDLLLQPTATDTHSGFWVRFNELNDKLMDCLSVPLALEELRATTNALDNLGHLPPKSQQIIIDRVYPEKRKDLECKIFHEFRSLIGVRWRVAWFLTLLVEYLDPANPLSMLEKLQSVLNAGKSYTWSDERWEWFAGLWPAELKEIQAFIQDHKQRVESTMPSALIIGLQNATMIVCPETVQFKLFLESMRQQLANPDLLRSLTCPFKGQRRRCCGLGQYLRGILAGIPKEYRRRLKPPSKVCLK
jgi:hypothetical protein